MLHREQDWVRAAAGCGISEHDLAAAVRAVEDAHRCAILRPGTSFRGFTPEGEAVVAWAIEFCGAVDELKRCFQASKKRTLMAPLIDRRSISPKRLCEPGPESHELDLMIEAALRAPDHGALHPWRILEFSKDQREALADCFEQEKRRRDPLAAQADLRRAREHALRPPVLTAFIVSPRARMKVPVREQWLAAGAALGNLLNAAHQLGYGAIVLSGERCFDDVLGSALGLGPDEFLAGFISMGCIAEKPPARKYAAPGSLRSRWAPPAGVGQAPGAAMSDPSRLTTHGSR